ncbi:MAG: HU family DNA-binding protein [Aestuariivita sp.]|nr:HU family DNA-binding protein [Aestuariivita sp.]
MQKPITKSEFVAQLAEEIQENKSTAAHALDTVVLIISKELEAGRDVTLPGIGKFKIQQRPERIVRNPRTMEQFKKPADKVVKVTVAKALQDKVNQ